MINESKELSLAIAKAASDKKAKDIVILDMEGLTMATDYFVICSASSAQQAKAIADNIEDELAKSQIAFRNKEGYREGRWVLLDYNECVAHIFVEEERNFYNIDGLWGDARKIEFTE